MSKQRKFNSSKKRDAGKQAGSRPETNTFTSYEETVTTTYSKPKGKASNGGKSRNGSKYSYSGRPDNVRNNIASFQGKDNDPSWYNGNGQLVKDAGSVSFYTPAGAPYFRRFSGVGYKAAVPGIMSIGVLPVPGKSVSRSDAVNMAALKLYTGMRKANSGATNYSHADLMMYCLAMDSVYCLYSDMLRLYGTLNSWSQYNRYKPEYVVQAMGYNYNDFRTNMADFRAWLNIWIKRANSFSLPVTFTISKRHSWLFSNIWADSTNAKAQLYLHRLDGIYQWDDQSSDQGSTLRFKHFHTAFSSLSFAELRETADTILDSIANSEDIAIMGGDLEKAFGSQNMYSLASIDDNYSIEPTFSEEVLMQIENSEFLGQFNYLQSNLDITQNVDTNTIVFDPSIKLGDGGASEYLSKVNSEHYNHTSGVHVLNVHFDNPSPDDVMVATRNKINVTLTQDSDTDQGTLKFTSLGTEILVDVRIFYLINSRKESEGDGVWVSTLAQQAIEPYIPNAEVALSGPNSLHNVAYFDRTRVLLGLFDWHPIIYTDVAYGTSSTGGLYDLARVCIGDLDNYTTLDDSTLAKLHDAAVWNMWDIPIS